MGYLGTDQIFPTRFPFRSASKGKSALSPSKQAADAYQNQNISVKISFEVSGLRTLDQALDISFVSPDQDCRHRNKYSADL